MPRISAFFGIVIHMYWNERDHPVPHFHAEFGDDGAAVSLDGDILGGALPPRQQRLVREWAALHRAELMDNWERARNHEPLKAIEPLS